MSGEWRPIESLPDLIRHYLYRGLRPEEAWKEAVGNVLSQHATAEEYKEARAIVDDRLASWREIVAAYRRAQQKHKTPRPSQVAVAFAMDVAEDTLRVRLREWHAIRRYQEIHARILLEP
jgi:hypothetical protein